MRGARNAVLALACLATACVRQGDASSSPLRELLGADLDGAKIVALRDPGKIVRIDLKDLKPTPLGKFAPREGFDDLGRPVWSPAGDMILFSYDRQAFLMNADGSARRRILRNQPSVYDASFWRDPEGGDLCVVFTDRAAKNGLARGKWGNTLLARLRSAETEVLFDIPCDAGLSTDGRWLGEAYAQAAIVDLRSQQVFRPHQGQACNASISPDDTGRLLFLYLPHTRIGIKNRYGAELWSLTNPKGTEEWQSPRWSNHPDYCSAVAKIGDAYKIVVIRISTRQQVVLDEIPGDWYAPHLWLPSAAGRAGGRGARSRVTTRAEAEEMLRKAAETSDARQARALLTEIADRFPAENVGKEAARRLKSAALQRELEAQPSLDELLLLADRLRPVSGAAARYDDARYFGRNRAVLSRMARLAARLRSGFPGSKAAASAARLAATYALPDRPPAPAPEQHELIATIEAVSAVPSAQQIAPYREVVTYVRYTVDKVLSGDYGGRRIVIVHWGMRNARHTTAASWRPGLRQRVKVDLFDSHPELDAITRAAGADDPTLTPYWALAVEAAGARARAR